MSTKRAVMLVRTLTNHLSADVPMSAFIDLHAGDAPGLMLFDIATRRRYWFDTGNNASLLGDQDAVEVFARSALVGEVAPTLRSDPIPEEDNGEVDSVTVVVGGTFERVVLDSRADVLLCVYREGDRAWSALKGEYGRLARKLRAMDPHGRLVIARLEQDNNEAAALAVLASTPALLLFPAGERQPVTYPSGAPRDVRSLVIWVQMNAATGFAKDRRERQRGGNMPGQITHREKFDEL
jgi:hypothetical protein